MTRIFYSRQKLQFRNASSCMPWRNTTRADEAVPMASLFRRAACTEQDRGRADQIIETGAARGPSRWRAGAISAASFVREAASGERHHHRMRADVAAVLFEASRAQKHDE